MEKVSPTGVFDASWLITRLDLKQLGIIFDKLVIIDLENWLRKDEFRKKVAQVPGAHLGKELEVEWLIDQGFLVPTQPLFDEMFEGNPDYENEAKALRQITNDKPMASMLKEDGSVRDIREYADYLYKTTVYLSRIQAIYLRRTTGVDAFPVCDNLYALDEVLHDLPKAHVMNVVLNSLPVPVPDTSWEAVFDFRSDPDTKIKFTRLRSWVSQTAKQGMDASDLVYQIEALLADYEAHMKFHKIKSRNVFFQTSIITTLEVIENIVKFQWSNTAKTLFDLQHQHLALLEAEMKAPGRELAFISKAREVF